MEYSRFFPQLFKEIVVNGFSVAEIAEKEAAINRFAMFWKLTHRQFEKTILSELNKVGLFVMLDYLDHKNPLIRNASKNWLVESQAQLNRIIDPLFEVLLYVEPASPY